MSRDSKKFANELCETTETEYKYSGNSFFKDAPQLNAIGKEELSNRVAEVFQILGNALAKSFGPYGAATIISDYPRYHITKDGFTIMKNLEFNAVKQHGDQVIADLAASICGRLNYTVGDGTTTAMVSTNSIYQAYMKNKDFFTSKMVLPRDVIKVFNNIKNELIEMIQDAATPIKNLDADTLGDIIRDIVYVSSNADDEITDIISDLYKKFKYPAIISEIAKDGVTKVEIVEGYKSGVVLLDKLFANNDNGTMELTNSDVIIFDHRITQDVFDKIILPLNALCESLGRHLLVIAPDYDSTAMLKIGTLIKREYDKKNDSNLVLLVSPAKHSHDKMKLTDLAMLLNTQVITRAVTELLLSKIDDVVAAPNLIDVNQRKIPDIKIVAIVDDNPSVVMTKYNPDVTYTYPISLIEEHAIRAGFVDFVTLGMNHSVFRGFHFDENLYKKFVADAEQSLVEAEEKYKVLGTFNLEVNLCQTRVYLLGLKLGIIYVGGNGEMSQKMIKDAVDDAVKASVSAYNYGVISGCNVTTLQMIEKLRKKYESMNPVDNVYLTLICILEHGFRNVYNTVLSNAFEEPIRYSEDNVEIIISSLQSMFPDTTVDIDLLVDVINYLIDKNVDGYIYLNDIIIEYSVKVGKAFDLSTKQFSGHVINSSETDMEVLKATIELMQLLITGNQMVLTMRSNF